jgi:hypothetical protein
VGEGIGVACEGVKFSGSRLPLLPPVGPCFRLWPAVQLDSHGGGSTGPWTAIGSGLGRPATRYRQVGTAAPLRPCCQLAPASSCRPSCLLPATLPLRHPVDIASSGVFGQADLVRPWGCSNSNALTALGPIRPPEGSPVNPRSGASLHLCGCITVVETFLRGELGFFPQKSGSGSESGSRGQGLE